MNIETKTLNIYVKKNLNQLTTKKKKKKKKIYIYIYIYIYIIL